MRVDLEVVLEPADALPPRTITRAGVSVGMNRAVDAAGALRLSGSGMERLFISFTEHRLLSHDQFADQLAARPMEDDEHDSCGRNRVFVYGRRTKEGDTRLLVVCVEGLDTVERAEVSPLVMAYWRHVELSSGNRAQHLAAGEHAWAFEAVEAAVRTAPVAQVVDLLEELLAAEGADPVYLGAGPVEDLLTARPQAGGLVAQRCRASQHARSWQRAVAAVWLRGHHHQHLAALAAFLPPPIDAPQHVAGGPARRRRGGGGHVG